MRADVVSVRWIGHATVLIEAGDTRVLTDPAITPRLAHLRRRAAPAVVPPVDVVAISHLHLDHLHGPSLRRVAGARTVVVPRGAAPLIPSAPGRELVEVTAGDVTEITADVRLRTVPAAHSHGRGPHSRVTAAPVGYVVEIGGRRIYFAGDTDLFDAMAVLGDLGRIDVALLPIWGWGPTLGHGHLDPGRAATATQRIDPVQVIPIHWGTYSPVRARPGSPAWLEQPVVAFREALAALGLDDRLHVLRPGGSVSLVAVG